MQFGMTVDMMKNFVLVEAPASRREPFLLLQLTPEITDAEREYETFSRFARWLVDRGGYSNSTIESYCEHAARFIDYVYEVTRSEYRLDPDFDLEFLLYSYQSFLLFGTDAENPLSKAMAYQLGKIKRTSESSLRHNIEYAIRHFLEWSSLNPDNLSPDSLFGQVYTAKPVYRSQYEVSAHKANSWLAGTISGALTRALPKKKGQTVFPRAKGKKEDEAFKTRTLEPEQVLRLVEAPKPKNSRRYWRDMAFYSLLAATGARTHEALQVRLCDLKMDENGENKVELHSPFTRTNLGLTEPEHNKLFWKGRETHLTFMIEPFATIFWESLRQYLQYEYRSNINHDFLFQNINGRPFFAADRSSRDKTFKKYARSVGIKNIRGISLHSLRHMYGTYVLNYLPMPDGRPPGLPIAYVQKVMGHASLSSTTRYAKHDTDLIDALIEHSSQHVRQQGRDSLLEVRVRYYQRQLETIESYILNIQQGGQQ